MIYPRDDDDHVAYYNPAAEIYTGLWTLFAGASTFLALRLWVKLTRRHGLWYDDYVLLVAFVSDPTATATPTSTTLERTCTSSHAFPNPSSTYTSS